MQHDFRHAAMHRLADWPVLARLVARNSGAERLDSRSVAAVYATRAAASDWAEMTEAERAFARESMCVHPVGPRSPDPRIARRTADIPNDEGAMLEAELKRMARNDG